jgi:hypothetical protein
MAITNGYGLPDVQDKTASVGSVISTAGPLATALFAGAGPVGGVLASIASVLQSLGIATSTPHFSWAQAQQNIAIPAVNKLWPLFQNAYNYNELQLIASYVRPRFLNAMATYWGTYDSQNQAYLRDVDTNSEVSNALNNQLVVFFEWVGTNIDKNRAQDELLHVVPIYFSAIFEGAISDAGLDPNRLVGTQKVITDITGPDIHAGDKVVTPSSAGFNIGNLDVTQLLFIGVIVGGLFLATKKKRG